jgi:hypothetical protein
MGVVEAAAAGEATRLLGTGTNEVKASTITRNKPKVRIFLIGIPFN